MQEVTDGREDIDVADILIDFSRAQAGRNDDQGDPEGRIVGKEAVGELSVLSQRFTVVTRQNDQGFIEEFIFFEIGE